MVPEKTCDGILGLPKVGLSLVPDIRMSWRPVLDENAGWELKIRTIARATIEGDPAAALAAVLGRPFPGIELFDRVADTVFFIKDHEARYVAVNETLARRCGFADSHALIGRKASEVFCSSARRAFRGAGSQGHRRRTLDPGPDGAPSLSGRRRRLVPDLEGAADRREPASFAGLSAFRATRRLCRDRRRFRRRFQRRSPISTIISTSPCAFRSSRREPAFPRSSSIKESGPCSASPPGNICPGFASTGPATGSGTPTRL